MSRNQSIDINCKNLMTCSNGFSKSVLITGGAGFVGAAIAQRLMKSYKVIILDTNNENSQARALMKEGVTVLHENVCAANAWRALPSVNYVIHAAAQTSAEVSKEDPIGDLENNLLGTVQVAEYARHCQAKIVFCNTIRVYDPHSADEATRSPHQGVGEDCPLITINPVWEPPFAISKLVAEQYLRYYALRFALPVVSLRMSGIVGPGQLGSEKHAWVSYLAECAVMGWRYQVFGDGNQSRDILHIDDYADLMELLLRDFDSFSDNGFGVYNVGGGWSNCVTLNKVISLLQTEFGLSWPVEHLQGRAGEPRNYATRLDRIKAKGWEPTRTDVKLILREIVEYYKKKKLKEE